MSRDLRALVRLASLPFRILAAVLMGLAALTWLSRTFQNNDQRRDWRGRWR